MAGGEFTAIDSSDASIRWRQRFDVVDGCFARIPGVPCVCGMDGAVNAVHG